MKIYFATSYSSANVDFDLIKQIIDGLKASGHTVMKRPFKPEDESTMNKKVSEVLEISNADIATTYKSVLKKIREADLVIAESTETSLSIGYEIATAQAERKPILCVYNKTRSPRLPNFFLGNGSKLFKVIGYSDAQDANQQINKFVEETKNLIDTKFILIISPQIDKYLNWAAEERRMHKAQIVRNAIEEVMLKDKEYNQMQKDL